MSAEIGDWIPSGRSTPHDRSGATRCIYRGSGWFAALTCLSVGFAPAGFAQDGAVSRSAEPKPAAEGVDAVSLRYRFLEKYATDEDPAKPWLVNQYQVGTVATRKLVIEKPQGAPERSETTLRMRFTERAARVNNLGDVTDAVRRYDKFEVKGLGPVAAQLPLGLFDKLLILYHTRAPGQPPQIVSLDPARSLRDEEYRQIAQSQVFFPTLKSLIPTVPTRIGDKWPVSVASAERLLGKLPDDDEGRLEGTLLEVKRAPSGQMMMAIFGISGELGTEQAPRSVNAHVHFVFRAERAPAAPAGVAKSKVAKENTAAAGVIEARGWISEVRLAEAQTLEVRSSRLRSIITREIVMGRRPFTPKPGVLSGMDSALTVPDPLPVADEQNSWLTFKDPAGRFSFRHPQELQLADVPALPDAIEITNQDVGGRQVVIIRFEPKDEKTQAGRSSQDPDHYVTGYNNYWRKNGIETLPGPAGWLPDADWSPLKRRVYRREVAMLTEQDRIYHDFYLVLFTTNKVVSVEAMTSEEGHIGFRDRVETMIRTFSLGTGARATESSAGAGSGGAGAVREKAAIPPR